MAWVLKRQQTFTTHLVLDVIDHMQHSQLLCGTVVSLNCFCYKTHNNTQLLLRVYSEMISNIAAGQHCSTDEQNKKLLSIEMLHVLTLLLQLHVF